MGERLVVTIQKGKRNICALHYQWGAIPFDSVCILDGLVQELMDIGVRKANKDIQLAMIRFAERNGGGISGGKNGSAWKYVENVFPEEIFKANSINRNKGLIGISPEEICNLNSWADSVATINLEAQEITNWTIEEQTIYGLNFPRLPLTVNPATYSMLESATLAKEIAPAKKQDTIFYYKNHNFIL